MRQRDVTDDDGTTWTCVQAFTGPGGDDDDARIGDDGRCRVVCTPDGGAASVALRLSPEWAEALDDAALLAAIEQAA